MSIWIYLISAALVLFFSGLLAMAGLGAAFLFVPLFYYLGVPIAEITPTALLLNVVSLLFATVNYWRGHLIHWRIGIPILITAVIFAPIGARLTEYINKELFLGMFAAFLIFAGFMMLFYQARPRTKEISRPVEAGVGASVGGFAGFLGGLLGVGGGNFIVPVLNWFGLEAKVAAGTTALVVVFASFSGFLGHMTLGGLDPWFVGVMALMAAIGSIVGSQYMKNRMTSRQLKRMIGILLWLIALKMIIDIY
jgi:uncharacterized protein